jgi:3-oxoacyl-[acyl-carrier protein] reductase
MNSEQGKMANEFGNSVNLDRKIALVTGAATGIGRATAKILALHGATVIINYNSSKDAAESLLAEILPASPRSVCVKADIANSAEIKELFAKVSTQFGGRLDILVNNAGILKNALLLMTPEAEWDKVIDINLKGTFLCMQQGAKLMMRAKGGRIINISSIIGVEGNSGNTAYSASKAGVIGLTKSAAKELGIYGINVNAIAPGLIDTAMTQGLKEDAKQKLLSGITLGRIGTPEDIARAVLFLSSSLSDYVTGQVIGVDGGMVV